jgi:hypothetical protein
VSVVLGVQIPGLRDMRGRFASMALEGLVEIQRIHAEEAALTLTELYKAAAPEGETRKFKGSIHGTARVTATGFEILVETDEPDVERWLREGTGIFGPRHHRIVPVSAPILVFFWPKVGKLVFAASVKGMPPNPWRQRANLVALPVAILMGNRIGVQTVHRLAGH